MKQQIKFTQSELSQSQEDKQQSTLIDYKEVEKTPFTLIKKEDEVYITIGRQLVTNKTFKTWEDASKFINKKDWMLITTTAMILAEKIVEQKLNKEV